jgi:hypothetical protein
MDNGELLYHRGDRKTLQVIRSLLRKEVRLRMFLIGHYGRAIPLPRLPDSENSRRRFLARKPDVVPISLLNFKASQTSSRSSKSRWDHSQPSPTTKRVG